MKREIDPRMHSAEHILSQTMVRLFDCGRPLTTHIEKKKSKCDYRFSRALTEEEIKEIEGRVNEVIETDVAVTEEIVNLREAEQHYNLEGLPKDIHEGIRIVKIGGYDACPCIGPHVKSTQEVGGFRIVSSSFGNGVLRIRIKLARPQDTGTREVLTFSHRGRAEE
jgi:misacylated tRNA(Ala) deacylase